MRFFIRPLAVMGIPALNCTRSTSLVVLTLGFFLLGMMLFSSHVAIISLTLIPFLTLHGTLDPRAELKNLLLTIALSIGGVFPLIGVPGALIVWPVESILKPNVPNSALLSIYCTVSVGWPLIILPWLHLRQRWLPEWSRWKSFAAFAAVVLLWAHLLWAICVWQAKPS